MQTQVEANSRLKQKPSSPEVFAWVWIVSAYHHIAGILEDGMKEYSLSLAQFEVLARIHYDPGINQNELASRLLVSKGNICGLLKRMEANELVERRRNKNDLREKQVFLTHTGERLIEQTLPAHIEKIHQVMAAMSHEQMHELMKILGKVAPVPII